MSYRIAPLYRASNISAPDFSGAQRALNFNAQYLNGLHKDIVDKDARDRANALAMIKENRAATLADQQNKIFENNQTDRQTKLKQDKALANSLRSQLGNNSYDLRNSFLDYNGSTDNGVDKSRPVSGPLTQEQQGTIDSYNKDSLKDLGVEGLKYLSKKQRQAQQDEEARLIREKQDARQAVIDRRAKTEYEQKQYKYREEEENLKTGHKVQGQLINLPTTKKTITDEQYKKMRNKINDLNASMDKKIEEYTNKYSSNIDKIKNINIPEKGDLSYGKKKFEESISNLKKQNPELIKQYFEQKDNIIKSMSEANRKNLINQKESLKNSNIDIENKLYEIGSKYYQTPKQDETMIPMTPKEILYSQIESIKNNPKLKDWQKADFIAQINKKYDEKVAAAKNASRKEEKFQVDLKNTIADTLYKTRKAKSYGNSKYDTKGKGTIAGASDKLKLNVDDTKRFKDFIEENDLTPNEAVNFINQIKRDVKYDNIASEKLPNSTIFNSILDDYKEIIDEEKKKDVKKFTRQ